MGCISSRPETTIYNILERLSVKIQNHRHSDDILEAEIRQSYQEIIRIVKREQKVMYHIEVEIERFYLSLKIQRPLLYYRVEKDSNAISSFMQVYNYGTARFSKAQEYGVKDANSTVPNFDSTPLKPPRKVYRDEENETTMVSISYSGRGTNKPRQESSPPDYPADDIECGGPSHRVKITRDMRNSGSTDQGDAYPNIRLKRMFYANENTESQETIGDFGFYDESLAF